MYTVLIGEAAEERRKLESTKILARDYYDKMPWYNKLIVKVFRRLIKRIATRSPTLAYERGTINSYAMHEIDGILQRLLGK